MKYTNAHLTVNTVDLSAHVRSMELPYSADMLDGTTMGDTTHENEAGLLNWSVPVTFKQSFAAAAVDATLFDLVGAVAFAVAIKPVNAAIAATNPEFQGNAVIENYSILSGNVGDLSEAPVTFQCSGTLVRDTTP